MKTRYTPLLAAALATILSACDHPGDNRSTNHSRPAGVIAGWPAYGGTAGGGHFSAATQINPSNVHQLQQVWEHNSSDIRHIDRDKGVFTQSSFQATPIIANNTLYYCSGFNQVFALDPATGEERWRYNPNVDKFADVLPNCRGVSFWSSDKTGHCEQRILMGTLDARLIALDATSGKLCEDFGQQGQVDVTPGLSPHKAHEYGITSPPAIIGNLLVTGSLVLDNQRPDVPSGVVRAYHVRSGELAWAWNPVPSQLPQTDDQGNFLPGTTNVWSIIAVDETRGLVFVPTGNTSPDYYGGHRNGLDMYSSSVVALNAKDGTVAWHYQMVHHDIWDYDTPAQPTLLDLNLDGKVIPALVQVTKMGLTFVLHRETGEPIWPVEERAVPQQPATGEYLSPTQPFPTHVPSLMPLGPLTEEDMWGFTFWDAGACRDQLKQLRNEGIYTPPSTQGSVFYPGNGGGNNWGSPAIDPHSGTMIVVTMRSPSTVQLIPKEECGERSLAKSGMPYCFKVYRLSSPLGVPCTEPPWGTLDAVDLAGGKILWRAPLGTTRNLAPFPFWWIKGVPPVGGPILTASGLVFVGAATDHRFRAFDSRTGEELWDAPLPTSANSTPMTYQLEADGRQFVVVAAGGHWGGFTPPGDHLVAFALP